MKKTHLTLLRNNNNTRRTYRGGEDNPSPQVKKFKYLNVRLFFYNNNTVGTLYYYILCYVRVVCGSWIEPY